MIKKSFICILSSLLLLSLFMPFQVDASTIQPYSYYSPNAFTFKRISPEITKNYDGNFMAIEATATSSSGVARDITISVYISGIGTKTYKTSSNGITKKFDYISLGSSNSKDVSIICKCNSSDTITMKLTTYSW